jgi:CRP-like cAMP-binding protein
MLELVRKSILFQGLPANVYEEISRVSRGRSLSKHTIIFHEGDSVESIYLITHGRVKHMQHSLAGNEVVLRIEGVGAVISSLNTIGRVHKTTACAIDPLSLVSWDIKTFNIFANRYPQILHNANRILHDRLHQLENRFVDISTERVSARLARVLLSLMEQGVGTEGLGQEEVAQMIGTTLYSVSRVLSEWAANGIVRTGREAIHVYDVVALTGLATTEQNNEPEGDVCRFASSCPRR